MTWYVTDKREYVAAYRRHRPRLSRDHRRATTSPMTAVEVSALIEDRAKVEIEATAVVPD